MKKKIYIAPETEVIQVENDGHFLKENSWVVGGGGAGNQGSVKEGDPDPGSGIHFAKEHSLWDEEFEDAKNGKW